MALNNPYALSFDGSSNYIDISSVTSFTDAVTLEAWVITNIITPTGWPAIICGDNPQAGYQTIGLGQWMGTQNPWIEITTSNGNFPLQGNLTISTSSPTHVAMVYDGTMLAEYVNGVKGNQISATGTLSTFTSNFPTIGSGHQYWNGWIDEIRIWNRALSETEINNYMNKKLKGNEPGLVAYYRCDEGYSNTLIDSTPNENHGTIYGATYVDGLVNLELGYLDVVTLPPTDVTYDSMTMNGELRGVGNYPTVDCKFQYSDNPEFGKLNDINNPYALSFDGVDDYVTVSPGFNFYTNDFYISFWAYLGNSSTYQTLISLGYNSSEGFTIITKSGTNNIRLFFNGAERFVAANEYIDTWLPIILHRNGTTINFIVADEKFSMPYSGNIGNFDFILGKSGIASQFYLNGNLDEIIIRKGTYSLAEIQNNMNKCLKGNEDGLVAYYRCDEGEGTTLIDATGNGNDGTIYGASYVPGEVQLELTDNALGIQETEPQTIKNTVLSFDGVNDYMNLGVIPFHEYINGFTIQIELKTSDGVMFGNNIAGKDYNSVFLSDNRFSIQWANNSTDRTDLTFDNTNIIDGASHQLTAIWDGLYMSVFLDSLLHAQTSHIYTTWNSSNNYHFMATLRDSGTMESFLQGTLDEIRIWNRALSQAEIQRYMNKQLTGKEPGLITYYRCDNDNEDNSILQDYTDNGHDGTIYGATYVETPENLIFPVKFSENITGLDNSKPYYYRAVATTGGEMLDNYNPYSLFFDGVDDYVKVNSILVKTLEFTVDLKVYIDSSESGLNKRAYLIGQNNNGWQGYGLGIFVEFETGKLRFEWADNSSFDPGTASYQLTANDYDKFISFAFSRDSSGVLYMYKEGQLVSSIQGNTLINSTLDYTIVGGRFINSIQNSYGKHMLDEIRIWNKALSEQEIQNNMNRRLTGDEEGLVAYYRCDKQVNHGVLIDSSGNDNHGVIYGATWVKN